MGLAFQIAVGIVLGVILLWLLFFVVAFIAEYWKEILGVAAVLAIIGWLIVSEHKARQPATSELHEVSIARAPPRKTIESLGQEKDIGLVVNVLFALAAFALASAGGVFLMNKLRGGEKPEIQNVSDSPKEPFEVPKDEQTPPVVNDAFVTPMTAEEQEKLRKWQQRAYWQ